MTRGSGLALLASCLLLAACASEKPKPTPLEAIEPQLRASTVWSARPEPRVIATPRRPPARPMRLAQPPRR